MSDKMFYESQTKFVTILSYSESVIITDLKLEQKTISLPKVHLGDANISVVYFPDFCLAFADLNAKSRIYKDVFPYIKCEEKIHLRKYYNSYDLLKCPESKKKFN